MLSSLHFASSSRPGSTAVLLPALIVPVALLAVPLAAQVGEPVRGPELDPRTGLVRSASELVIEPMGLKGAWLELTPLASDDDAAVLRIEDRSETDGELRWVPGVADGAAMLCSGERSLAVLCEQVYLSRQLWIAADQSAEVAVRFEPGLAITGRYLLAGWPIAGARVAVVPAGMTADRPFTLPLGLAEEQAGGVRREVTSDDAGRFRLPRLAEGEYFLEALLPSGRVHRSAAFQLPAPGPVRRETTPGGRSPVVWDLGEIDVADGLVVAFEVADLEGRPLPGARVTGRQGTTPESLIAFEAVTDGEGTAKLSGFSIEEGVRIRCRKPGYRSFEAEYSLLPVLVNCVLEPLAGVRGEVIGVDGTPPAGARVALERLPGEAGSTADRSSRGEPRPVPPATLDPDGRFVVDELIAGDYTLRAAAPGFAVARRLLAVAPGQILNLEAIVLSPGRPLEGRVIDRESGEGVPGAEIRAVSPPGAARATSDEDGNFTLATGREPLVLRLAAEAYAGREFTVDSRQLAGREPLILELERGGRIRALVWDEAAGLPCQSCRLVVRPSSSELLTDDLGEAVSETLAPGTYRVYRPRVRHLGSAVVEEVDAEHRTVRVRRGRTSTVRFGERRRVVRVLFEPAPEAGWTLTARSARRVERFRRGTDGAFRVRQREGESLDLYLHRYDPAAGAEAEIRQATLPAGFADSTLVLPLRGAMVQGRATSASSPLAGLGVTLMTLDFEIWASARTRPDGSFRFAHVPPGVYTVVIGQRSVQLASLRRGQTLDLGTFELAAGGY